MPRRSPIFYSALALTAVNLLLRLVSTSFQVYLSGIIGPAGVGLLQLVLSVGSLAMTAGIAGIRTATMYLTAAQLGKNRPQNVYHILSCCMLYSILCSGAVGTALYFLAPQISAYWIGNPNAAFAIRLLAGFLPVSCLCGVMTGYFTAAGKIGTLAIVEVAEQLLTMAITMGLLILWAGNDIEKACGAVISGSGIGACFVLITLTVLRHLERNSKSKPFPTGKKLLEITIPLALADDLKAGINTAENLMVPKRLSLYPGASNPMALFGTVCAMVFPILMFPAAIVFSLAELLIPEIARCQAAEKRYRIDYLSKMSLRIVLIYGFFFAGLLFTLAEPLCQKLYPNTSAAEHLTYYAFLAPILYCDIIVDAINKGLGMQKISVRYNILTAALDIVFLFLLLPKWGMTGYFISFVISHLLNFILSLRLFLKHTHLPISPRLPILTGISAVISLLLSSVLSNTIMRCSAFILVFICLLTLFGILSRKELFWLKGLMKGR